jgi:hypothetical protein
MNQKEYDQKIAERKQIISRNRSRLLRGLPRLEVPEKPEQPKTILYPFAYSKDDTYEGRLNSPDECPEGCIVKWEKLNNN